jgi:hypothetical protein
VTAVRGAAALLLCAVFASCFWLRPVQAATLHLREIERLPIVLDDEVEVLEDRKAQFSLEAVEAQDSHSSDGFVPGTQARMRPGFTNSVFWLRLSLANDSGSARSLRLVLNTTWLQYVDFHVQREQRGKVSAKTWMHEAAGISMPGNLNRKVNRVPTLALELAPGEQANVLVRVQSRSSVKLAPVLHTRRQLARERKQPRTARRPADRRAARAGGLFAGAGAFRATWPWPLRASGFALVALYEATYRGYARLRCGPTAPNGATARPASLPDAAC